VSAGRYHTCGAKLDGSVHCWGANFNHEVSVGGASEYGSPQLVFPSGFVDVAAGCYSSCALDVDGVAWCWGDATAKAAGPDAGSEPERARGQPEPFTRVAVGAHHACAVGASGALYCWGDGYLGELGGELDWTAVPMPVLGMPE
jgi:alpha-tubulin suppressor-like RCC1 family protein